MDFGSPMRVFTRVVERRSFSAAAQDLGQPCSAVTDTVKQIETRLGLRLLQRSTHHVSPTPDGEAYYRRCLTLLADLEESEHPTHEPKPQGLLRIAVQSTLARHFLLPSLPDFLDRYPNIEILFSESDRWSDRLIEDADCILHFGDLANNDLIARDVILLPRVTCAAPAYLAKYGMPSSIESLPLHHMVGIRCLAKGTLKPLEFMVDHTTQTIMAPAAISVCCLETALANARLGLGIVQLPAFLAAADLAKATLVEILAATKPPPVPVSLLYARNHQLAPRVKIFLDWAVRAISAQNPTES